mgnify:CR=1 FL=1
MWQLVKVASPKEAPPVLNTVPNLLLLDDKAVLGLLTRRFTRTVPLVTHVVYGEWDDARVHAALVCASVSCPDLRREAFALDGGTLDRALDEQMAELKDHLERYREHYKDIPSDEIDTLTP